MLWVKLVFSSTVAYRQPIEKQQQVNAVFVVQRIAQLTHHAQPVGAVARQDVRIDGEQISLSKLFS